MIITTERLVCLVEVANSGSFSAAARNLGVSPSAVNQVIQNMEIDLDLTLFDRTAGKAPVLTEAGKVIYFQAQEITPRLNAIERKALSLKEGIEPKLTIALHGLTFYPEIQQAIISLNQTYPELELSLVDSETTSLSDGKVAGADIIIAPADLKPKRGVESLVFDAIKWCFVVSPLHDLAKVRGALSMADLEQYVQLLPAQGQVASLDLIESLRHSSKTILCDRLYQLRDLMLAGLGFALYPEKLAQPLVETNQLKILSVDFLSEDLTWPIEMTWTQALGPAGLWLVEELSDD